MLPYLHILIRVEEDGALHALGAFTSKEKLAAYQKETGLEDSQVRLDFCNGPFEEDIKVIYAGHRRWNMDRFQLAGYFQSEDNAWDWITQEGYVSVLRIDVTHEEEKQFQQQALELYAKLQKNWRLASYQSLIESEGEYKAKANITLRFYEDALESLKPKSRRDIRALYALAALVLVLPVAIYFYFNNGPDYGQGLARVSWLPDYASDISYYRSNQVQVFEFHVDEQNFERWAEARGMHVQPLATQKAISRYKAYIPTPAGGSNQSATSGGVVTAEQFERWQSEISITVNAGLLAKGSDDSIAIYDANTKKAYYELLTSF
ncbi:MAG: hypothetical protein ACPGSB_04055 [Opitutales bacterium]